MLIDLQINWSRIPPAYKYVAVDPSGAIFAYTHEPSSDGPFGWDMRVDINSDRRIYECCKNLPGAVSNWQDTLETRPEPYAKTLMSEFPGFSNMCLDSKFTEWTPSHDSMNGTPSYTRVVNGKQVVLFYGDKSHAHRYGRFVLQAEGEIRLNASSFDMLRLMLLWALVKRDVSPQRLEAAPFDELVRMYVEVK